jgi:ceramide glucosyltransferase
MIEWIICGFMLVWISSLAILVLAARRSIARVTVTPSNAPSCPVAVFVPVAGMNRSVESSIRSLLTQTPPSVEVIFALRDPSVPESVAVQTVIEGKGFAKCVFAGSATACGQKNQNLLAGIAAVSSDVEIFVFADAGHSSPPGWLELLVAPIARGEAEVTSGYHAIRPADRRFLPWVYAVCVEIMHVFQNAPGFSQPWGGAMAISRAAFERLKVSDTWRTSIVDDVSLAKILKIHGVKVRTVPFVRRETLVSGLHLREFFEWMVRQFQYIRFIFPGTWVLAGAWSLVQILAFAAAGSILVGSLLDRSLALSTVASALYLLLMGLILLQIRLFHPLPCTQIRWLAAGAMLLLVFAVAFGAAGIRRQIQWRGIKYHVGRGGRVLSVSPQG